MSVSQPQATGAATARIERASLLVLGMAAFMVQADARVIDPLLHVIRESFTQPAGGRDRHLVLRAAVRAFQLLYGPIGDRVGKIRVMAACLAVFSLGRLPARSSRASRSLPRCAS